MSCENCSYGKSSSLSVFEIEIQKNNFTSKCLHKIIISKIIIITIINIHNHFRSAFYEPFIELKQIKALNFDLILIFSIYKTELKLIVADFYF
jgi:hypothetical protein